MDSTDVGIGGSRLPCVEALTDKEKFEGGATRSKKLERYDLIPPEADLAMATRFGIGALVHGEGNWKSGGVEFIKAVINHLRGHLSSLLADEPPLADAEYNHPKVLFEARDWDTDAITCNAAMLNWFRIHKPIEFCQALNELRQGKVE